MKAKAIFLQNFRCFEELSLKFDDKLTVIVADNGMGKTTILDGIAVAFGRLLTKLPNLPGIASKRTDIRIVKDEMLAPFLRYWICVSDVDDNKIEWSTRRLRDNSTKTQHEYKNSILPNLVTGTKQLDTFAEQLIDKENNEINYTMPVIAYYGTSRAVIEVPKSRLGFRKSFSRFDSLTLALSSNARFRGVFEWFVAKEDEERRAQVEKRDFQYRLPELQAVRKAIESMLPEFSNPRTILRPMRFVVDWNRENVKQIFRVEQLSDGYKTTLAMVMDIARRMAQANPPDSVLDPVISDPLDCPAIILIDEVDLHLHPKWQQRILPDLLRTFKNAQFIVTTHSPQVLTTVPPHCIRQIRNGIGGKSVIEIPDFSFGAESSYLLKSIQHVEPRPQNLDIVKKLNRYLELISQDNWDSEESKGLRIELDLWGHEYEPILTKADIDIRMRAYRKARK